MRPRNFLIVIAAILLATFIVLNLADSLLIDLAWFESLGFRDVFTTTLLAQTAIFGIVWLITFVVTGTSGLIAFRQSRERERLHVVRRADSVGEVNLPELLRSLGDRVPWKLIILGVAALLGVFVATSESSSWDIYLKGLNRTDFGSRDPAFGLDIGFFIFTLPLLEELRDLFFAILAVTAILTGAVYWIRGGLDFRESPPQISRPCAAHLSVLLGLFFLQRGFGYWLARYALTLHTNGVVFGLRYVDEILWKPGLWILVVLAVIAAMLCIANVRESGVRLPLGAAIALFGPALLLNFVGPVVEKLWVKPDELRIEQPYITRNIQMTRQAYQLDNVDVKPFKGTGKLTLASLEQDAATVKNIRLWDPRPLIATYQQLQEIRLYYNFLDVDIDRYWLGDGDETQVMLSGRELNVDLLPANAQTWVNRHLKFTHGYGLVMSPVNTKDQEGLPVLYMKNIPPQSTIGFDVTRPGIYFGEAPDVYAIVNSATPEFDYPSGNDNVFDFYKGHAGVAIDGLWRRILFALYYRDTNLLVTENIVKGSQILFRRNISERVRTIAPFLGQDNDPYLVIHDGGLYWMIDCYTTSNYYPYSQTTDGQINYIRNSVKVTVNAYTGETTFFVADITDPIIQTWSHIYPHLFQPISAMPADMHAHIRYPEQLFLIQAAIYGTYHMTDPAVFYNREDVWSFPRESYEDVTGPMQPYYVNMRLPGEKNAEYILMLPMVPQGRDNMIAWLAARCDGADYGHLFEFAFSKDRLFYGPYQIQARINQNPDISKNLSLWNQMGSKVLLGNLLVIPIEDALLYVEPLYIRAQNGQLPELTQVIASYSDRTVMGPDLKSTLEALFKGESLPAPAITPGGPSAPAVATTVVTNAGTAAQTAAVHYDQALDALKRGDWKHFGEEMQLLGEALKAQPNAPGSHP
ncbi:MAG TPA: UPF0182 family protein [Candidatus Binataceae bacterium]|nr:UPF0182 family protein [Candidatus Binataceae bacterium]